MKRFKHVKAKCRKMYGLMVIIFLFPLYVFSQDPVIVNVTMIPPYSSAYGYYENLANHAVITLTLNSQQYGDNLSIVLHGRLTFLDQNFTIETRQDYMGGSFQIQPNIPKVITNDVAAMQFLRRNNLESGSIENEIFTEILRTGQLPEGRYEFCVSAWWASPDTWQQLGSGCTTFSITNALAPKITSPFDGQVLNPQIPNTVFSWTPPIGNIVGANLAYDLYVVKVAEGQNPNDAINGAVNFKAGNPIIKTNLTGTQYVTQPYDLEIDSNQLYAVQVVVRDLNKQVGFANDGRSEVVTFSKGGAHQSTQTGETTTQPIEKPNEAEGRVLAVSGSLRYFFDGYEGSSYPIGNSQLKLYPADDPTNSVNTFYTKTDKEGNFKAYISAGGLTAPSNPYKLEIISPYYRQIDTAVVTVEPDSLTVDTTSRSIGQLITPVYSYSLDLRLEKRFRKEYTFEYESTRMDFKGTDPNGMPKWEEVKEQKQEVIKPDSANIRVVPAGIPIQLYRKVKSSEIPFMEGDLLSSDGAHFIPVASAKTAIRVGNNGEHEAYVKFNRLVCNLTGNSEDVYYIKAFDPQKGENGAPFQDGSFEAPEQELVFSKPDSADSTHFEIDTTYNIFSNEPPKSTISGQLLYQWPGDPQKTLRPLANRKFSIVAFYLKDGKPIRPCPWTPPGKFTVGGKEINNPDGGGTMASGMTDENGNFVVDAYNLNLKGMVAGAEYTGTQLFDQGCAVPKQPVVTPGINLSHAKEQITNPKEGGLFSNISNVGFTSVTSGSGPGLMSGLGSQTFGSWFNTQNAGGSFSAQNQATQLNAAMNLGNNSSFNVNSGFQNTPLSRSMTPGHGPNPGDFEEVAAPSSDIQRVFRIVLDDDDYFYNPDKNIVVQPNANIDIGPVVSIVKEVEWKITARDDDGHLLDNINAVIFREPVTHTADLPITEGNGKYEIKELLNPQYSGQVNWPEKYVQPGLKQAQEPTRPSGGAQQNPGVWVTNTAIYNNDITINRGVLPYEWLSKSETSSEGEVSFDRLLGNFSEYYLELATSSQKGSDFYEASITQLKESLSSKNRPKLNKGNTFSTDQFLFPAFWDEVQQKVPVFETTVTLKPKPARIFGRIQDEVSREGLGSVTVDILIQEPDNAKVKEISLLTDENGYFELLDLFDISGVADNVTNITVELRPEKKGFHIFSPADSLRLAVSKTGRQAGRNILMTPDARIIGKIVDEEGNPVSAIVQREDKVAVETRETGMFEMPVPPTKEVKFFIIPQDPKYFRDTLSIDVKDGRNDIGTHTVYKRLHRMRFFVQEIGTNQMIGNVKVALSPELMASTQPATMAAVARPAEFEFENVSVNNYTATIEGPEEAGYVATVVEVKNEESKDFKNYVIQLKKGGSISGIVTLDGKPVEGAKVYLDFQAQSVILPRIQLPGRKAEPQDVAVKKLQSNKTTNQATFTDAQGRYVLNALPVKTGSVNIVATLDTSFTVNGDRKEITLSNGKANVDLTLTSFTDMEIKTLFGFPLEVEKIESTSDKNKVKVTGLINLEDAPSDFKWVSGSKKQIRVSGIEFSAKEQNGKRIGLPVASEVPLDATSSLKLGYKNFNVRVTTGGTISTELLKLKGKNNNGTLTGFVNIVDNSFNYPATYLNFKNKDGFYLGQITNKKFSNELTVFSSEIPSSGAIPAKYLLSDEKGKAIQFQFVGFEASAVRDSSYIAEDGLIHLMADLSCRIPNATPEKFKVRIPEIVLDGNEIRPAKSETPLVLSLEEWKLEIRNWELDPVKGGIYSENGLVKTGKLDIPFSKFNLRPDLFIWDDFRMSDIALGGGVKKLEDISSGTVMLTFDPNTGSDKKGHWKFSITSQGSKPAGVIRNLARSGTNYLNGEIHLGYVELLSNGEDILTIQQDGPALWINDNSLAQFSPQVISSGRDFFEITGGLQIPAPRLVPIMTRLKFTGSPQALSMEVKNLEMSFEGKGYVNFFSDTKISTRSNTEITKDIIRIDGYVLEKEAINPITAVFYAENPAKPHYHVDLEKNYNLNLSETITPDQRGQIGANYLRIKEGGMEVPAGANDWGLLSFTGIYYGGANIEHKSEDHNVMEFTVDGDVSVNGDNLSVSNIDMPFGNMSLIYIFPEKTLKGTVAVGGPKDQEIGPVKVNGVIKMVFAPAGFYIAGGLHAKVPAPFPFDDWNMGLILGAYKTIPDWQTEVVPAVTQYSHDKNKICWLKGQTGIDGFFITAGKDLINVDLDYGIPAVANVEIKARASVEASIYASFSNWMLRVMAGVNGLVKVGASAAGVSAGGQVEVEAGVMGEVSTNHVAVGGELRVLVMGYVDAVGIWSGNFDVEAKASARIKTGEGVDAGFSLGRTDREGCPTGIHD